MATEAKKKPTSKSASSAPTGGSQADQHNYAENLEQQEFDFGLVVGDAFVRGIRDIGYRHSGTALDELIDNSLQAGASRVDIAFGFGGKSDKKPDRLAVIDDGHGMARTMIRASMLWGGTHRENDRTGFGRYGYGLPSASISQGRRFSVYSVEEGGEMHKVTFDLDQVKQGTYTNGDGRIIMPAPETAELPDWVVSYLEENWDSDAMTHGTVVLIEQLDRLSWVTANALKAHLLEHFGVTYRNYIRETSVHVDGTKVEPVDPLFLTPGMRFYDIDEERAEALEPMEVPVKDKESGGVAGVVKVRFSYMSPTFQSKKKDRRGSPHNARFSVMKAYNRGIIVSRAGRQIDVVDSKCPWYTFQVYDRNWGVEIDFPPTLDEEFSITTSKQQVVLSERMWEILEHAGVRAAIRQMKKRFDEDIAALKVKTEESDEQKRASEIAMEEAQKFKTRKSTPSPEKEKEKEEGMKREVKRRSQASGVSEEQVEEELRAETEDRPYKVDFETHAGAPFFRVEQLGGQRVLWLNKSHRFFRDLYAGPGSAPRLRAGLEVLLFVIGESELDAERERRLFYETERAHWSQALNVSLDQLDQMDSVQDELAAKEAAAEYEVESSAGAGAA